MDVKKIRFPETSGIGIKPVSEEGTKRLVRAAIQYAVDHGRKSVTLVHKGNIMKFTEGAFKNWGYEVAEQEFSDKVFTWAQYDRLVEEQGKQAANEAQAAAEAAGKNYCEGFYCRYLPTTNPNSSERIRRSSNNELKW
ncbi:hypothetical protein GCM10020331_092930 [Ectobacillus funiculus]